MCVCVTEQTINVRKKITPGQWRGSRQRVVSFYTEKHSRNLILLRLFNATVCLNYCSEAQPTYLLKTIRCRDDGILLEVPLGRFLVLWLCDIMVV